MSSKNRVGATLKSIRGALKGGTKKRQVLSPPNISSIEKASFLDDDNTSFNGNPLHSTALDDDLSLALETMTKPTKSSVKRKATNVGTGVSTKGMLKGNRNPRKKAASVKSSYKMTSQTRQVPAGKRRESNISASCGTLSEEQSQEEDESDSAPSGPALESAHKSRGRGTTKATTPVVQKKMGSRVSESRSASRVSESRSTSSVSESRSTSSLEHAQKSRKNSLPTNEERRQSSPRSSSVKRKVTSKKRNILSEPSDTDKPPKKEKRGKGGRRSVTDLEVVLAAFQDFVSNYIKTLEPDAVIKVVNAFSESFENELTRQISEIKELNNLKKQNVKIDGAINRKRARLVEVKNELIKKEMELRKLQKENSQLGQRLADIRTGTAFLGDLQDLQKSYLAYRQSHPNEVEVYGPSSLPAFLLDARSVMGAEHQLRIINQKLQQVLDQSNLVTIDSNE